MYRVRLVSVLVYSIISLFVYLLTAQSVHAAGEFLADYDVQYAIAPSGKTVVTQNITLTNKQTTLYPRQYQVVIDSERIHNVIAYDSGGVISPAIAQKEGKTTLLLTFNKKVVGLGKKLPFTLRYENDDVAQKHGAIWEVTVPGIGNDPDLGSYTVELQVPSTFGPNAYTVPLPAAGQHWTKDQLIHGGITAAYGQKQAYAVELSYYIQNTGNGEKQLSIALPPDTAFQNVAIQSLVPPPIAVTRDEDGNWLASYSLGAGQALDIAARVMVVTVVTPRSDLVRQVSPSEKYLAETPYWQRSDPKIQALAAQYKSPQQIYDYVTHTLTYNYDIVRQHPVRMGAVKALEQPTAAICREFTDLFIAIARAAGIPAREAIGYAYTTNPKLRPLSLVADVLHAWPEYWDSERELWIPVDPTWGNTTGGVNYFDKLDFYHVTFALHGVQSDQPLPAGFYRRVDSSKKDVNVTFADPAVIADAEGTAIPSPLTARFDLPRSLVAGLPLRGALLVENKTGSGLGNVTITLEGTDIPYRYQKTESYIPPYAKVSIPIALTIPANYTKTSAAFTATVKDNIYRGSVHIQPLYSLFGAIVIGGIATAAGVWIGFGRRQL